jgi:threonylcarbamoyladenosine tRNA methylthiotransferase MtaB
MPHLHLSLQSGNDLILKRMKRRHTKQQAIDFCKKVRNYRNDVVFGADIIAGFPTETDKMFEDSINLIKKCNLTHLHVFPFSPRKFTPAASMPQVPKDIIKKRASILREFGINNLRKYLKKQIGSKTKVLIEQVKDTVSIGKSQHFTKIEIHQILNEGSIVDCIITDVNENTSKAILIS